ncbi:MAG: 4Fe-4S dicluster domain-containing protein [Acetobacteraceae bacterium]|nr:4Fe-4S dicluster domain-containing protein [Acetobacteraceae bacterium]
MLNPGWILRRFESRAVALARSAGRVPVSSCAESPVRRAPFDRLACPVGFPGRMLVLNLIHAGRWLVGAVAGVRAAARALEAEVASGRPQRAPQRAGEPFWAELEDCARSLGINAVGYARVPPELVFRDMAVLYPQAVVLLMEMGFEAIDRAPAPAAGREVMRTYAALGEAANALCAWLNRRGFPAQAGHPLGGAVLYPALAYRAGLGVQGRNGLLLHPCYGPRHRLAAVFTDIADFPPPRPLPGSEAARLEALCDSCWACVAACPTGALAKDPVPRPGGLRSYLDPARCFPFFMTHLGCSLCIKVCPLSRPGYGLALREREAGRKEAAAAQG